MRRRRGVRHHAATKARPFPKTNPARDDPHGTQHQKARARLVPQAHGQSCPRCGVTMDAFAHPNAPNKAVLDHVIPASRGGPSVDANYVVLCWKCNRKKSDRLPGEEYPNFTCPGAEDW